jgi:arylsulfatase A-like enzyme
MVEMMDRAVGVVLKALEDAGVADRTVVIFTSDNGGLSTAEGSPTSNVPLRAGKGWMYEGGVRVPLVVRWPGAVSPGSVCDQYIISTDYFPTLLEIAGLPARPEQHVDAKSFVPLLKGARESDRGPILWHYPHYGNQGGSPASAIRDGDWKLIEFFEDGRTELYNLADDIGERSNLAAREPLRTDEMLRKLREWRTAVGARLPTQNPNHRPTSPEG